MTDAADVTDATGATGQGAHSSVDTGGGVAASSTPSRDPRGRQDGDTGTSRKQRSSSAKRTQAFSMLSSFVKADCSRTEGEGKGKVAQSQDRWADVGYESDDDLWNNDI